MDELFRIETDRLLLVWSASRGAAHASLPINSPPGASVAARLFEQTDYLLFLRSSTAEPIAIEHRDPVLLRDLTRSDGGRVVHGRVNFGSQVGRSAFTLSVGETTLDFEVEIFPTKLDYAEDYARLTAETQEILTGLVLEYLRSTFQLGRTAPSRGESGVEWLTLLRHASLELERGLQQVARQPQRTLLREPQAARAERVQRTDADLRRAVLRGRGWGGATPLAGGATVRERLEERRARPTLDTPEHRWLAAQLARIRRRLARLRAEEAERGAGERRRRTLEEIDAIEERIVRLARLEPLAAATGEPPPGFASLQLQSTSGYREAYRACLLLSHALHLEGGPVRLALKELHLLYEYWCFLTLVRLVAEELGQPLPAQELLAVEQLGLRVRLLRGRQQSVAFDESGCRIRLTYNPLFAGEAQLVPQRPDILLEVERPDRPPFRAALDAKYRLDASPPYLARYGSPGPPEEALNTLHRYRDAIRLAGGVAPRSAAPPVALDQVIALFPYGESEADLFRSSRLWRSLATLGVGAIPLLPGRTGYLAEWLRSVLSSAGTITESPAAR